MRLNSIEIKNFLSIQDAVVNFDDTGLVLVEGWNFDTGRANAAGKTAIFNAISFALYNKLPRKITASEILRRGTKAGSVTLSLMLDDGSVYTVKRCRPIACTFTRNGEAINMTQEEFESKLKLSYDQFLVAMYCAQGTETRFLYLNDVSKKDFIVQLLGLSKFSSVKKLADTKIAALEQQVASTTSSLNSALSRISVYEESLVDEQAINQHIASLSSTIRSHTEEYNRLSIVVKPDLSKYAELQSSIEAKKADFITNKVMRSMLIAQRDKLKTSIKPFNKNDRCAWCGSVQDLSEAKSRHETECSRVEAEISDIVRQISNIDLLLSKEAGVNELANKLAIKISTETKQYDDAVTRVSEIKVSLAHLSSEHKTCVDQVANNAVVNAKVKELQQQAERLQSIINDHKLSIEMYKTVSAAYSPTGAQAYVLDSVVDSFNNRMEYYVSLVWPNVTYALKSYRENAKGDLTAKLSEILMMNGEEVSIGSLSGGENRALSICADLSIIDVVSSEFSVSLNPLIFDEPFDGLDHVGRELVVDLLERVAQDRQIFVVDHSSEAQAKFTKVIRVEKRDGISVVSAAS